MGVEMLQGRFGDTVNLHILLLRYLWGPGANVLIILVLYSYRKWWAWVHGVLLSLSALLTIAITFPMLIAGGYPYPPDNAKPNQIKLYRHASIGVTCMVLMVVVSAGGLINKMGMLANTSPKTVQKLRWGHRIGGYILLILLKSNYYLFLRDDYININIITDAILIPLFILRKVLFPKMGGFFISKKHKDDF